MIRALVLLAALGCGRAHFDARDDAGGVVADALRDGSTAAIMPGATSATTAVTANALGWTHGGGTGDVALVVFVGTRSNSGGPAVTSILYGSANLTKIVALCAACGGGGNNDNYELWYLPAPPPGPAQIQVFLAGMASGASGSAISYSGSAGTTVDQTATGFATSATALLDLPTGAGAQWAIAGAMLQGGEPAMFVPGTGQFERAGIVCDSGGWEGQTAADEPAVTGGQHVVMSWAVGSGSGANCISTFTTAPWIALGASFK